MYANTSGPTRGSEVPTNGANAFAAREDLLPRFERMIKPKNEML
jgi:hypothetical protein